MVLGVVAGHPGLQEGPGIEEAEGEAREQRSGEERIGDLEPERPDLPAGHDP
jgi:hypothetical protein